MTDRAGPPSLRNEPWRPGTTSPGKPPGHTVAERDAACTEWVDRNYTGIVSAREIMIAKTAFCAGWSGGVNYAKNNSPEPVDLRCAMCKTED